MAKITAENRAILNIKMQPFKDEVNKILEKEINLVTIHHVPVCRPKIAQINIGKCIQLVCLLCITKAFQTSCYHANEVFRRKIRKSIPNPT